MGRPLPMRSRPVPAGTRQLSAFRLRNGCSRTARQRGANGISLEAAGGRTWIRITDLFLIREALCPTEMRVCRSIAAHAPVAHCCRQIADETPRHGPSRLTTSGHRARPEPWIVQRNRTRLTTAQHAFGGFPIPGVVGSIPTGGTSFPLHTAIALRQSRHSLAESARLPTFCRRESLVSVRTKQHSSASTLGGPPWAFIIAHVSRLQAEGPAVCRGVACG